MRLTQLVYAMLFAGSSASNVANNERGAHILARLGHNRQSMDTVKRLLDFDLKYEK